MTVVMSTLTASRREPFPAVAVRAEILEQHEALQRRVHALTALAGAVLAGERSRATALIATWATLRDELERHMAFEESVLGTLLATVDPRSPMHAHFLVTEHRRQRHELAGIDVAVAASPEEDLRSVARAVLAFAAELQDDMKIEERTLLGPDVLQDDIVTADQDSE
jgi:hypothetical protein